MTFEKDKIYKIDSGMGGTFDVKYKGLTPEGKLKFKVTDKGWTKWEYTFSEEEAIKFVSYRSN